MEYVRAHKSNIFHVSLETGEFTVISTVTLCCKTTNRFDYIGNNIDKIIDDYNPCKKCFPDRLDRMNMLKERKKL